MGERFAQNPIIKTSEVKPSSPDMEVACVLNPGVFSFAGKTWLILRVAERPKQREGFVSFPIMHKNGQPYILEFKTDDPDLDMSDPRAVRYKGKGYLSTLSHLRLVCSDDGVHFNEPTDLPTQIFGRSPLETFGIEDCRVSMVDGTYCLTFTQVSEHGVGVGLMRTRDWVQFQHDGMIIPPHNKDCAIFEEKINGKYYCLHNGALPGTIVKITSPATGKSVYAKVLDVMPAIKQNDGVLIRLSNAAAAELGQDAGKFDCSLSFTK